jgi:hypothetical protein
MKLRYFIVTPCRDLRKAARRAVKALWEGRCGAGALGGTTGDELRLVSVVCDNNLLPRKIYLLRLPLCDGLFTETSYLTLKAFTRSDCMTAQESVAYHADGWPADLFQQLAVVLDVPVAGLDVPLAVGGPLFLAAAMHVTPRQALRYLR